MTTILNILRSSSIIRVIYGIIKISIPVVSYFNACISKPKLINYSVPWIISNLDANRSAIKDEVPWVTFEAKEWIEAFLIQHRSKETIVFEYGSGGSTVFFTRRVSKVISAEHNQQWYAVVCNILQSKNVSNCKYLLMEPQSISACSISDAADPQSYASHEYENMSFEAYVKSIDAYPNECFDMVFIDGRARPSCILHARNKVKSGGIIILDNSERNYYSLGKELLSDWEGMDFYGPGPYGRYFWQTSIFKCPANSPLTSSAYQK